MKSPRRFAGFPVLLLAGLCGGCAAVSGLISRPEVQLSRVQVQELDFSRQVFLLGFVVDNPNPFSLPVTAVSYGLRLDGQRFATGETGGGFTVPANGAGDFSISVELDLLKSAPSLWATIRDATRGDVPYELTGSLAVDLPFAKTLDFRTSGEIRLQPGGTFSTKL